MTPGVALKRNGPFILEVRGLSIKFGGVQALDSVNLAVPEGEAVGLIGPNGAGKTTLFNCVSGFLRPTGGSILFRGQDITSRPPHRRALLGIGRTFQGVGLCKGESLFTNMLIAQHQVAGYAVLPGMLGLGARRQEENLQRQADGLIELLGLRNYRNQLVRELSAGLMRLAELACVLVADPALLLLDETAAGLSVESMDLVRDVLLRVQQERKLSILMIGHVMRLIMSLTEYIYVLNFGQILAQGLPRDIRENPGVIAAYLGGAVTPPSQGGERGWR